MSEDQHHNDDACCSGSGQSAIPARWSGNLQDDLESPPESDTSVCRLDEERQKRRQREVVEPLVEAATDVRVDDDGVTFSYAPDTEILRALVAFVDVERTCCPFFGFELRVAPDGGPMRLTIEAPQNFDTDRFAEVLGA